MLKVQLGLYYKIIPKAQVLVILGPTASGKSAVAIELAKKYDGEIISADSRQVYRGLDIGSGKVTKQEMAGIPHYLLDVADPKKADFSVAEYKKLADKALADIVSRGKLPIICGGTAFYIQAVVDGLVLPEVTPNLKLRTALEKLNAGELFKKLKELDPVRAKNIDANNPRRLIRAIEIAESLGKVPKLKTSPNTNYDFVLVGIKTETEELKKLIKQRLEDRLENGLIEEVETLKQSGLTWQKLDSFGLEYRYVALYLQSKLSLEEMAEQLNAAIWHYAKRQLTWWKRDARIEWLPRTAVWKLKLRASSTGTKRGSRRPASKQSRAKQGKPQKRGLGKS